MCNDLYRTIKVLNIDNSESYQYIIFCEDKSFPILYIVFYINIATRVERIIDRLKNERRIAFQKIKKVFDIFHVSDID